MASDHNEGALFKLPWRKLAFPPYSTSSIAAEKYLGGLCEVKKGGEWGLSVNITGVDRMESPVR